MQLDIYFRDLGRTDALEAYLQERIQSVTENFLKYDEDSHITVRVESDRHRTQNRKPSFTCEIILKPSHQKATMKVRKSGEDFYTVVSETANALRTILRRRSSRKAQHRRREHERELYELLEMDVA